MRSKPIERPAPPRNPCLPGPLQSGFPLASAGGFFKRFERPLEKASPSMLKTIIFVDYGQDYLEFDVNDAGVVVEVRPYSDPFYKGVLIKQHEAIEAGSLVQFERTEPGKGTVLKTIMYPVESVHVFHQAEEVQP